MNFEKLNPSDTIEEGRRKIGRNFDRILEMHGGINAPEFIQFANAYKGEKDDFTRHRIRVSAILEYEATTREKNYLSKPMLRDLGDNDAYGIYFRISQGGCDTSKNIYFWNKKQRDETLAELDRRVGVFSPEASAKITMVNPSELDRIPDLPRLD